ncbi:MAG: pyridoxamine 5'-phosphate oxidase family protein [Defluviitaleaceae bacterium]|nr:pyridoxamine 5'-phosphate oxidase family protein [Defluviitaleaceae bacterium]
MIEKANEFLKTCGNGSFSVLDESGHPSSSAIWLMGQENVREIYFSTPMGSNKYKRLQKSAKAGINCYSDFNNLTLVGDAVVLTDQESKTKHWQEMFIHIYPEGPTDPNYCVIKFATKRISMHIDHQSLEFNL